MKNQLPFFKFYPVCWLVGNINYLPLDAQGLFISICAHYWVRHGELTIDQLKQLYSSAIAPLLDMLMAHDILKYDENGKIVVKFLDEQLNELSLLVAKKTNAGKIGAEKRWGKYSKTNGSAIACAITQPIANDGIKDKDKDKDKEKEIEKEKENIYIKEKENVANATITKTQKKFIKPTLEEIMSYAAEKHYTNFDAERFWDFYEAKGWMIGKNKMRDWRAAVRNWVKGENDRKPQKINGNGLAIGQTCQQEGYLWN